MSRRDSLLAWFPVVLKYTGIGMTILITLFWGLTYLISGQGVIEPALLAAFGSMYAVGEGSDAIRELKGPGPGASSTAPEGAGTGSSEGT